MRVHDANPLAATSVVETAVVDRHHSLGPAQELLTCLRTAPRQAPPAMLDGLAPACARVRIHGSILNPATNSCANR
jgi:hypothetical protein